MLPCMMTGKIHKILKARRMPKTENYKTKMVYCKTALVCYKMETEDFDKILLGDFHMCLLLHK